MAQLSGGQNLSRHADAKSANPAQGVLLIWADKNAERPQSHTFNVCGCSGGNAEINAAEAELKCPKALARLIETSLGDATEGTGGHEGGPEMGRCGAPHRWARPLRTAQ